MVKTMSQAEYSTMKSDSESTRSVYIMASIASVGGLLYGYDLAVVAGAILFINEQFPLSPFLEEIIISIALLGAMIGAFIGGLIVDKIGRRKIIIVAALISILGAIISSFGLNVVWIIFGRVIVGFAFGIISFAAPLYISEIAPVGIRGWLVSLYSLLFFWWNLNILCSRLRIFRHGWLALDVWFSNYTSNYFRGRDDFHAF